MHQAWTSNETKCKVYYVSAAGQLEMWPLVHWVHFKHIFEYHYGDIMTAEHSILTSAIFAGKMHRCP